MSIDINPIRGMIASRLSANPSFMAHALRRYTEMENLTAEQLALELGTLPELVDRLALCRRPASDDPAFAERVRQLADYTLIDAGSLANVLRQVDAIAGVGEVTDSPLLAAARDHEHEEDGDAESEE